MSLKHFDEGRSSIRIKRIKSVSAKSLFDMLYFPKKDYVIGIFESKPDNSKPQKKPDSLGVWKIKTRQLVKYPKEGRTISNLLKIDESRVILCLHEYEDYYSRIEGGRRLLCYNVENLTRESIFPITSFGNHYHIDGKIIWGFNDTKPFEEGRFVMKFILLFETLLIVFQYSVFNLKFEMLYKIDYLIKNRHQDDRICFLNSKKFPSLFFFTLNSERRINYMIREINFSMFNRGERKKLLFECKTSLRILNTEDRTVNEVKLLDKVLKKSLPLDSILNIRGEEILILGGGEDVNKRIYFMNTTTRTITFDIPIYHVNNYKTLISLIGVKVLRGNVILLSKKKDFLEAVVEIIDINILKVIKKQKLFLNKAVHQDFAGGMYLHEDQIKNQNILYLISSWRDNTIRVHKIWGLFEMDDLLEERLEFLRNNYPLKTVGVYSSDCFLTIKVWNENDFQVYKSFLV